MIVGSWWLTREIELSTLRACLVSITAEPSLVATVHLPASKSDPAALGVARSHGCTCGDELPTPLYPVHAAWDQQLLVRRRFPLRATAVAVDHSLPLFPTAEGATVSKDAMTATIVRAAELLGIALCSCDGGERVSGHTLRPTGAIGLTRLGMDSWVVELLGRWGAPQFAGTSEVLPPLRPQRSRVPPPSPPT